MINMYRVQNFQKRLRENKMNECIDDPKIR